MFLKIKKIAFIIALITCFKSYSQKDSTEKSLSINGYLELYYGYDFAKPTHHQRLGFVYSHNRHNEVNLNLGFVKFSYEKPKVRSHLALMAGTYTNANLASEPGVFKNIWEANAGLKLSNQKNIWLDAGIFPSHIGFESAIGKDCWNLTRSILADNSPYYESGIKISYNSDNSQWFLCGLILNGWQRIQRLEGNNTPSFGHQVIFKPNPNITLNSSSFIGSDTPDSTKKMRYFHNFYGIFQWSENWGTTIGFDIGMQQKTKNSNNYDVWYSPVLITRYSPNDKISVSVRGEYYSDTNGVIIKTIHNFETLGYSINFDYLIFEDVLWRIEGRGFNSKSPIFLFNNQPANYNFFITTALAISF